MAQKKKHPLNSTNPKNSLSLIFHQVQQKMDLDQKNIFLKYSITPRQFIVLQTIDYLPGINQNQIVTHIQIDRSTVSDIIQKLETKNYIYSYPNSNDKRNKEIKISTQGRSILRRLQKIVNEQEKDFLRRINLDTKNKLLSSLKRYARDN